MNYNTHQNLIVENIQNGYVRDEDGLWVTDRLSEEDIEKYRKMVTRNHYMDSSGEERFYHSFFAEAGISNRLEPGAARICANELGWRNNHSARYVDQLTLREIIWLISDIQSEDGKYDEDLNGLSFDELHEKYKTSLMIQKMRMDRRINTRQYTKNEAYKVIQIHDYERLKSFINCFDTFVWEAILTEADYDSLTDGGKNSVYVCLNNRYLALKPTYDKEEIIWSPDIDYADIGMEDKETRLVNYDDYGLSMLLVIVDMNGELVRCEGRYASYFEAENWLVYLDQEELSLILGRNFYDIFI